MYIKILCSIQDKVKFKQTNYDEIKKYSEWNILYSSEQCKNILFLIT